MLDGPTKCTSKSHSSGREPWVCVFHANTYHDCFIAFPEDDRLEYAEEKRHDQIQSNIQFWESSCRIWLRRWDRWMYVRSWAWKKRWDTLVMVRFIRILPIYWLQGLIDFINKICGDLHCRCVYYTHVLESRLSFLLRDISAQAGVADVLERNALVYAQGNASQTAMLVTQAIRASPRVATSWTTWYGPKVRCLSSCFSIYFFKLLISVFFISLVLW